jgi:hypothetical protein
MWPFNTGDCLNRGHLMGMFDCIQTLKRICQMFRSSSDLLQCKLISESLIVEQIKRWHCYVIFMDVSITQRISIFYDSSIWFWNFLIMWYLFATHFTIPTQRLSNIEFEIMRKILFMITLFCQHKEDVSISTTKNRSSSKLSFMCEVNDIFHEARGKYLCHVHCIAHDYRWGCTQQ